MTAKKIPNLTDEPFTKEDIITIQNPNTLDARVLVAFDHFKKNLKVDDEELKKIESNLSYNINVIGDTKQMLKKLGTKKAKEIVLHGGGRYKARDERADALATILGGYSHRKPGKILSLRSNGHLAANCHGEQIV